MKISFGFQQVNDIEFLRIDLPGAWAVFSTKKGGVSTEAFSSLNMALHVEDDTNAVIENRIRFSKAVGFSLDNVICAQQVHGTNIEQVSRLQRGRGIVSYADAIPETDAMITADKQVVLAAFFADCVPVYIVDPVKGVVALAHAGWKGTLNGIAGKTVQRMQEDNGTEPSDCFAFIGPSVGPCCYEVSRDLALRFGEKQPVSDGPQNAGRERWKLDLWGLNKKNLVDAGLDPKKITVSEICTVCHDTRFFSHRRDSGLTGRMAAFISVMEDSR